ncbi:MAG TPA: ABC transporter substrate-binding protein [Chloroflexota bacterium]|nr:ABC transporter substrate-binding protein [Chloroflexota bacterium]
MVLTRIGAALIGMAIVTTACAAGAAPKGAGGDPVPAPPHRKHITAAILGNPYTLSQAVNTAGTGSIRGVGELEKVINAGLTKLDEDDNVVPQLAKEAPSLENGLWTVSPDGTMQTTWNIKPDATWQDGAPFTAADIQFTATVVRDKSVAIAGNPAYRAMDAVTTPDERTVVVTWKQPFIYADQLFSYTIALPLPDHLLRAQYESDKASFLDQPYWTTDFVGTGAFKLREFVRDSHMIVEAWDGYVLGRPKLDEIEVRFLSDPNVVISNILAGEVDVTIGRGMNLEQALQVDEQWDGGRMDAKPSNWIAHYPQLMTPDPAVIGDVRFRRALLQGIDRKALSDTLQAGRAPVADTILYINSPEYRDVQGSVVTYPFDPRGAAQAIQGLGFARGADGMFAGPDGQALTIESRTNAGDDLKEKLVQATADSWRQIGVGVNTVVTPRQLASDREYRATNPGFDLVRQPFDLTRFISSEIPLPDNNWKGKNRTRYSNPELDGLVSRYYSTIPKTDRTAVLAQAAHILSDQVIGLGIFYGPEPMLISNKLVNVSSGKAADVDETWNIETWDLR